MTRSEVINSEAANSEAANSEAVNSDIRLILFDLDGTLTDSGQGIVNSVRYALEKSGYPAGSDEELRTFVGPPLAEQFSSYCRISPEEGHRLVDVYREYYQERGIFENRVYEGIPELLKALRAEGYLLAVATSKPEQYARQIAEHFRFDVYFDFIGGALMDGRRTNKAEVIEYVLEHFRQSLPELSEKEAVMIGDRLHDIEGAGRVGIRSIGVLYGYGSREELEGAKADLIVEKPEDILRVLSGL